MLQEPQQEEGIKEDCVTDVTSRTGTPVGDEDVEAYVKRTLLPYIRTGLEALLRIAAENGDLRDKASDKPKRKSENKEGKESVTPGSPFHPVVWLSDHLRQYAKPPGGKYRETFEQRMAEKAKKEMEEAKINEKAMKAQSQIY
eukprot:GEMP01135125.1.p1 GENE.GEMP01135125.1~~GEMP01135125.1.p1  ORF type:complete len:155 (+),score=32.36 GEMP01135125.1:37-465(+)